MTVFYYKKSNMNKFIDTFFNISMGRKTNKFGYIYLFKIKGTNIYKFGKARNPKQRKRAHERYFWDFKKKRIELEIIVISENVPFYDAMEVYVNRFLSSIKIKRRFDYGNEYIQIYRKKDKVVDFINTLSEFQKELCQSNNVEYTDFVKYCESNFR